MNRRDTLAVLLTLFATPLVSFAQQLRTVRRIGWLDTRDVANQFYFPLISALEALGY